MVNGRKACEGSQKVSRNFRLRCSGLKMNFFLNIRFISSLKPPSNYPVKFVKNFYLTAMVVPGCWMKRLKKSL